MNEQKVELLLCSKCGHSGFYVLTTKEQDYFLFQCQNTQCKETQVVKGEHILTLSKDQLGKDQQDL